MSLGTIRKCALDQTAARLELVRLEIEQHQQAIRTLDTIMFQIKGWAVTVGLASAGLTLTLQRSAIAVLAIFATVAFLAIDAQRKSVQRRSIDRCLEIERVLMSSSLVDALQPQSGLVVPQLTHTFSGPKHGSRSPRFMRELARPPVFAIYVGVIVVLGLVALVA